MVGDFAGELIRSFCGFRDLTFGAAAGTSGMARSAPCVVDCSVVATSEPALEMTVAEDTGLWDRVVVVVVGAVATEAGWDCSSGQDSATCSTFGSVLNPLAPPVAITSAAGESWSSPSFLAAAAVGAEASSTVVVSVASNSTVSIDPTESPVHAIVSFETPRFVVAATRSTNGAFCFVSVVEVPSV